MTTQQLDQKLKEIQNDYSEQIRSSYPENSSEPVTKADIHELARQTFYVLDTFRTNIIDYLSQN